jgi:hypothetical protein
LILDFVNKHQQQPKIFEKVFEAAFKNLRLSSKAEVNAFCLAKRATLFVLCVSGKLRRRRSSPLNRISLEIQVLAPFPTSLCAGRECMQKRSFYQNLQF